MKRFIRYLYEYEQEKRIRNVGFVKIEAGSEETIVHMQGKGFHKSEDRKLRLYLFYKENEKLVGVKQAEINLTTPVLSWHFRYAPQSVDVTVGKEKIETVNMAEGYEKIYGVLIETSGGRRIAATWDDRPVDVSRMVERSELPMPEVESTPEAEFVPEEENVDRKFSKIQRKDISRLPRCEWKLANNRFLVYGFRNYHHLILIEEGKVLKLGVPGIYHIEEAKMADRFGFGEFLSVEELDILLDKEEMHEDEPFGYWCRPVKKYRIG